MIFCVYSIWTYEKKMKRKFQTTIIAKLWPMKFVMKVRQQWFLANPMYSMSQFSFNLQFLTILLVPVVKFLYSEFLIIQFYSIIPT
jgi:hypothetical protein